MKKFFKVLLYAFAILVILVAWRSCHNVNQFEKRYNSLQQQSTTPIVETIAYDQRHWQISKWTDEMTDKETKVASIVSSNKVNFDFPYEGGSTLKMSIREKNNTIDVYFRISKGQFVCSEYSGTDNITIRFDDEPAKKYKASESSTNDSEIIFIARTADAKAILNKCKTAKTIKVQTNFYSEGSRVFTFEPEEPLTFE